MIMLARKVFPGFLYNSHFFKLCRDGPLAEIFVTNSFFSILSILLYFHLSLILFYPFISRLVFNYFRLSYFSTVPLMHFPPFPLPFLLLPSYSQPFSSNIVYLLFFLFFARWIPFCLCFCIQLLHVFLFCCPPIIPSEIQTQT